MTIGLITLTALSCLPFAPQGPFDARDYTRVAGMRLEQHPWVALIEPLTAPIQVVAGAPDFRVAGACCLYGYFWAQGHGGYLPKFALEEAIARLAVVGKALWSAFAASATLVLVIFFLVMAHSRLAAGRKRSGPDCRRSAQPYCKIFRRSGVCKN